MIISATAKEQINFVWNALLQNQGGTRSTNENITKDGRIINCKWYNMPLIGDRGEVISLASLAEEIADRKQAETERDRFFTLSPDLLCVCDFDGYFKRLNPVLPLPCKWGISLGFRQWCTSFTPNDLLVTKAPLRAIANLSEWIEYLENRLTEDLLRGRVHCMEALINGLLQYSCVGRVETPKSLVSVSDLLEEIIDSLTPLETFTIDTLQSPKFIYEVLLTTYDLRITT